MGSQAEFIESFGAGAVDALSQTVDRDRFVSDLAYRGGWLAHAVVTASDAAAVGHAVADAASIVAAIANEDVDAPQFHGSYRLGGAADRLAPFADLLRGFVATGDDAVAEANELLADGF